MQGIEDGLVAEVGSAAGAHDFDGLLDEAGEFAPRDVAAALGGFGKGEECGGEQVVQVDFLQAHTLIRDLSHYQLKP